ncbi:MAG TPA: hypothetical protein VLK65_28635 [Vicinamibacteria bacterium]|nr:hypothetical protein [Vicinamibacteria bacterium]
MNAETAVGGAIGLLIGIGIVVVVGIGIGLLARLLLPGRDEMSLLKTLAYGVGGSLLGGLIGRAVGIVNVVPSAAVSVVMAMVLIWFFTRRPSKA